MNLTIDPFVSAAIRYIRSKSKTEVTGLLISAPDDPLHVVDFVVMPAECSSVSVDIDDESLVSTLHALTQKGIVAYDDRAANIYSQIIGWWHTHPSGMGPTPSSQDVATFNGSEFWGRHTFAMVILGDPGTDNPTGWYCRLRVEDPRNIGTPAKPYHIGMYMELDITEPLSSILTRTNPYPTDFLDAELARCVRPKSHIVKPTTKETTIINNHYRQESPTDLGAWWEFDDGVRLDDWDDLEESANRIVKSIPNYKNLKVKDLDKLDRRKIAALYWCSPHLITNADVNTAVSDMYKSANLSIKLLD